VDRGGGDEGDVVVLVPLKRLGLAKTRLALPAGIRRALALAMAADVVAAARQVASVLVVSADPDAAGLGVPVLGDAGGGLDAAVASAAARVTGPVAVLAADLPAVLPDELALALAVARRHPTAVLADTPGTGTCLLTASVGSGLRPSYGAGSLARHVGLGAADLTPGLAVPGLRRDVDTLADLRAAARLGLGPATTALLPQVRDATAA